MAKMTTFLGAFALGMGLLAGPTLAEDLTAATVVATVNGKEITLGQMIATRAGLPAQYQTLPDDVLFKGILDQLVQQTTLQQDMEPRLTKRQVLELENNHRSAVAAMALDGIVKTAVTDEAIQAAYDARYTNFQPGTEYHAAHILVDSEDKAYDILDQIEGGVEFADAAKTHGTDGTAASGGDLGWFGEGMMVKPFEEAVMSMKAGELKGPIKTEFGWHLIKLLETRATQAPKLDDVREELAQELEQKAVAARLEELTKITEIEKPGEGIDPAVLKDETLLDK
ncbi:peptidylprolyl isomerase [Gemmobacter lanyuensis]|uniref:Parvulin-like PPIase n=1 Tax=Gemmobacter lanyuensis TaxID=1054497 RepID=A0A918IVR8_9RHOB|nr:peptidylprolyl isomerase [Gemmobacter lanyuensis]GGW32843.1 peptidylprolyl isomerase [Gemmobacter lanyuensis]